MSEWSAPDDLTRAVEAALFAATEPMSAEALAIHLGGAQVRPALARLALDLGPEAA